MRVNEPIALAGGIPPHTSALSISTVVVFAFRRRSDVGDRPTLSLVQGALQR